MKMLSTLSTWRSLMLLPLVAFVGCASAATESEGSSAQAITAPVTLTCNELSVTTGKTGGQPVIALATKDLSGTTDSWGKYVEMIPGASGFVATCTFSLPAGMTATSIGSLTLRVNYRGAAKAQQAWLFEAVSASGRALPIGDNGFAQDWAWSEATLPFNASPADVVSNGQIRVTYRTTSNADVSDIDQLVVLATTGSSTTTTSDAGTTDSGATATSDAGTTTSGWWKPTTAKPLHFAWQLSDTFVAPRDVRPGANVYDLDGELTSASTVAALHALGPDVKVICYFDAGVYEPYRSDASKFPKSIIGAADQGWPGLYWLDVRQLDILMPILKDRMVNWCKNKGFDAIEPDETEVWSNSPGFPITLAQNTAFNKAVADAAHSLGLSVGLKGNTSEAGLLEPYFDWALVEQCWQYNECSNFQTSFLAKNKAVFDVEYKTVPDCAKSNSWHMNAQKRDLNLVGPASSSYLYQPCIADSQNTW